MGSTLGTWVDNGRPDAMIRWAGLGHQPGRSPFERLLVRCADRSRSAGRRSRPTGRTSRPGSNSRRRSLLGFSCRAASHAGPISPPPAPSPMDWRTLATRTWLTACGPVAPWRPCRARSCGCWGASSVRSQNGSRACSCGSRPRPRRRPIGTHEGSDKPQGREPRAAVCGAVRSRSPHPTALVASAPPVRSGWARPRRGFSARRTNGWSISSRNWSAASELSWAMSIQG